MRTIVYDPNELVVIRVYAYEYEAEFARVLLESSGIPALLVRDAFSGLGPGGVRLAVCRGDAEEALAMLDAPAAEGADATPIDDAHASPEPRDGRR